LERRYLPRSVFLDKDSSAPLAVGGEALSGRTDEAAQLIGDMRQSDVGPKESDGSIDFE
jgi:hypothetical protein